MYSMRWLCLGAVCLCGWRVAWGDSSWPKVSQVEWQPLHAATERLIDALDYLGTPLTPAQRQQWEELRDLTDAVAFTQGVQQLLDPLCLLAVVINPESRVSVVEGPAPRQLMHQGWRTFLIKVHNQAGITAELKPESPNLLPLFLRGQGKRERPSTDERLVQPAEVPHRFLDLEMIVRPPLKPQLSGLELEYRLLQLYSREPGRREAQLGFHVGQGTQDIGFRQAVSILFDVQPAVEVVLEVKDTDGSPTTAAFEIRDRWGRVYPNPARRLAPDFFFHHQIYRSHGESVFLPPGEYTVRVTRGPEYHPLQRTMIIPETASHRESFALQRWIHPAARGWYSGDHHVHAAGCAHYDSPTEGVSPADMMRHILGEDLNVGCVLSWGPCWYTQKRYFEGKVSALSQPRYLMRYDVEVSGFPSSHAGHLCLLNLQEDDYPGTQVLEDWPSWTLPILRWGQQQGGVVGYSHSGWGLQLPDYLPDGTRAFSPHSWGGAPTGWRGRAADRLPDDALPRFDGIGANEFIVTGPLGACDFISTVDTPAIWELNIWYHTLNCGVRTRISGETDFPCIYGERVGLGRVYVQLPTDQPLDYQAWVEGLKSGRSYCGDGLSHIFDFRVNDLLVGTSRGQAPPSQLDLDQPERVQITAEVAAWLEPEPTAQTEAIRQRRWDEKPYWHIERCRLGNSRQVPLELVVNGQTVATQNIVADGRVQPVSFQQPIARSSWIALRILPSVHTNPVFVLVQGQPIRARRQSAQWCLQAVEQCWQQKQGRIRPSERESARAAYDQARAYYQQVLLECVD
ncbi:MAG: hypothetical protein KatS3mg114_1257 [Planctomycetaceae bacterium]|nr:MAG: hypothetical protein KatS3mg114_1257 [Planctomycetaceae bacterium]